MDRYKKLYFKQNVQIEPLVNLWYAWPYLISPATAAMVLANSQNRIMDSYIKSPEMHETAIKTPELLGGPFIDFEVRQVDAIKALMKTNNENCIKLLELAQAIKDLTCLLEQKADGHSLEQLYSEVPQPLRGYIELLYDLNNYPSFRFIEALLYESEYYIDKQQSALLTLIEQDYRPFSFSTPRLPREHQVHIRLPFNSQLYDKLFEMKEKPHGVDEIEKFIDLLPNKDEINKNLFLSFFTEDMPEVKYTAPKDDEIRIRYFGHACILIESETCSILTDPVISYKYENGIQRYSYTDLPPIIDYLIITHTHLDHVLIEHLLQLRHKVKVVIVPRSGSGFLQDPSLKLFFKHIGYQKIIEIDDLETIDIPKGSITGIPFFGEHSDLNIQTKKAYLIKQNNKTILCAADSNNIEPKMYEHIQKKIKTIDAVFIGMECDGAPLSWVYGSLLTNKLPRTMDQSRRLNGSDYAKAINLVNQFNCSHAYVYAMGQEPWLNYVMCIKYHQDSKPIVESNKFVAECTRRGIQSERLYGIKEIIL